MLINATLINFFLIAERNNDSRNAKKNINKYSVKKSTTYPM